MTTKEKSDFNDEFNEAEFFGFAKLYLSEAFPNPQRIGCPPDCDLQRMAEHPVEARDATVSSATNVSRPGIQIEHAQEIRFRIQRSLWDAGLKLDPWVQQVRAQTSDTP